MEELELKFAVPRAAVASLRRALRERGARATRLQAHYFDSADDALAREHVALRLRREAGRWVQTLKASGASPVSRFEHNVALPDGAAITPRPELARHAAAVSGRAFAPALAAMATTPLVERYATDVRRWSLALHFDGAEVEAALDLGRIVAGERRAALAELEFEWVGGRREALFELGARWAGMHGLTLDALPKSARGRHLAQGLVFEPPLRARAIALDAGASGGALLRRVLQEVLEQVLVNASEIARGSRDAEHVHQLRVGLRRLRTALRELAALTRRIRPEWDAVLARAARELGAARDAHSTAAAVEPLLRRAHAPLLHPRSAVHRSSTLQSIRAAAFQRTLVELLALAASPQAGDVELAHVDALAWIAQRLDALHRQVRRDGKRFESLPGEAQHRVRKRLKRLRYLAEFAAALWPRDAVARYLEPLERAQDALGRHNDLAVAARGFAEEARRDPRALFAAGYLQASLVETARRSRRALERVRDEARFWGPGVDRSPRAAA